MKEKSVVPNYIFETSWEVCNKVGGIYTVLSTKAKIIMEETKSTLIFIGPDLWKTNPNPLFVEDKTLYAAWKSVAQKDNLEVRIGRWNVPGNPIAFLVDYSFAYVFRDKIFAQAWEDYQVDSLHAYGDYDESLMFAYSVGKVVESFYNYYINHTDRVVFQAHEWMTGLAALYLRKQLPQIATIFTTHATGIGRSIAANGKPLYDYFEGYHGDQMAKELNMESKHSIEKQSAHHVDCFTTVSEITASECVQLLEQKPDVLLLNGFNKDFLPCESNFMEYRKRARTVRLNVASALLGKTLKEDTLIVGIGGRYEMRNKGIDVFLEALSRLNNEKHLKRDVVAFIDVPAWVKEPRADLSERLKANKNKKLAPLANPYITHWLYNMDNDQVLNTLRFFNLLNQPNSRVKVIFAPCYLTGNDGIFNLSYYDTIIGNDLNIYPSYYEPWGYTPLESAAFHIPTVTTDLAGFGLWVNSLLNRYATLEDGIQVIHRTDSNYLEVADVIKKTILTFATMNEDKILELREKAASIAEKALWAHFIKYYYQAYQIAFQNADKRNKLINTEKYEN